jgi:RNA polymerase-binding transcription factor DksA
MNGSDDVAEALQADLVRRLAQVAGLERSFDELVAASESSNADDEHDPEGATIAFERTQLGVQIANARAAVDEVEVALARAREGTYGTCQSCGEPIGEGRLEARPAATTCITCASR